MQYTHTHTHSKREEIVSKKRQSEDKTNDTGSIGNDVALKVNLHERVSSCVPY